MTKNYRTKKYRTKHNKTNKLKGAGLTDVLYKYTLGEKRSEIIPQITSIAKGVKEGYGIGGIGGWTDFAWDNGGTEYLLTVPLSSIILWHPVRGKGEREQAGRKTTSRANNTYNVLMNTLSNTKDPNIPTITYSYKKPLTYSQLNTIPEMASDDTIKICPVNIYTSDTNLKRINELSIYISTLNKIILKPSSPTVLRLTKILYNKATEELQDLLYQNYTQYFLVLSGQGRLQAIIEAVKRAEIPPDNFFIRLSYKNIYLDICNVLLKIHNSWVREGDFNDKDNRHYVYLNGEYIPMSELPLAFSCESDRSKNTTLCFAKYTSGDVKSDNMGCSDVYGYRNIIPWSRTFTK